MDPQGTTGPVNRLEARDTTRSLMTPLGLVEGDILTRLEGHGATTLRRLIRELDWPAPMVMMAVGALTRAGLVRAVRHDLEVVVEARAPMSAVSAEDAVGAGRDEEGGPWPLP